METMASQAWVSRLSRAARSVGFACKGCPVPLPGSGLPHTVCTSPKAANEEWLLLNDAALQESATKNPARREEGMWES